jgi:CheY-like chemotaxis protein
MAQPTDKSEVIVVVDPQPDDYTVVTPWAEENNIQCHFVVSGLMALRVARDRKPALWMVNVELPDMTGFDLLEMISDILGDPFVVLVANQYRSEDELRSAEAGATLYISKPLERSWLDTLGLTVGDGLFRSREKSRTGSFAHTIESGQKKIRPSVSSQPHSLVTGNGSLAEQSRANQPKRP